MPRSLMRASSMSSRSSRWLPPMISPMPGASTSMAATVFVVVHPHIERLDVLRVVHHDHGLLSVLLGEIALVLRLQVDAPAHRKLELLLGAFEHLDRLAVIHAHEIGRDDAFELCHQTLLDPLVEEGEILVPLLEQRLEGVL